MYAWLWRHLPGGTVGKIVGSVLLASMAVAALFLWVFPWVEENVPLLSSVTVSDEADPGSQGTAGPGLPSEDAGP